MGRFDEAHEVHEEFVVAGGDAPKLFELLEKTFDDVALFAERLVVGVLVLSMASWWDDRFGADIQDGVHQAICVRALSAKTAPGLMLLKRSSTLAISFS